MAMQTMTIQTMATPLKRRDVALASDGMAPKRRRIARSLTLSAETVTSGRVITDDGDHRHPPGRTAGW